MNVPPKNTRLIGELYINGWTKIEDNVRKESLPEFFDAKRYGKILERGGLEKDILIGGGLSTKFCGPPSWNGTNAIENAPKGCDFLFQTDGRISFEGEMPDFQKLGATLVDDITDAPNRIMKESDVVKPGSPWFVLPKRKGGFEVIIADFASDGLAFVFMDKSENPPLPRWTCRDKGQR